MVRIGTAEKAVETESLRTGRIELVVGEEDGESAVSWGLTVTDRQGSLGEVREWWSFTLVPLHIEPCGVKQRIGYAE